MPAQISCGGYRGHNREIWTKWLTFVQSSRGVFAFSMKERLSGVFAASKTDKEAHTKPGS